MKINHSKSELYFLLILITGIFVLAFFIFKPFLFTLLLAIVFATVFDPLHQRILIVTRGQKSLSALLSTICVLIVVIVPLIFLGIQVFREATQFYSSMAENGGTSNLSHDASVTLQSLQQFSPIPIEFSVDVNHYVKEGLNWILQRLGPLFANIAKVLLGIFVLLVALYYLFKDGHKLKKAVITLSPLQDIHDKTIFHKLALAINSVVRGNLTIACTQGILTTIGFSIFGIPNAVLWGSVATIAAIVPSVGTTLVILPGIIYLYFTGETFMAVGLLLWGMIAVGLVDNVLGPILIERGIQLHPFLILLSILGGIGFFGPLGFLLGPIVLSLFFAFIEIYLTINNEHVAKK